MFERFLTAYPPVEGERASEPRRSWPGGPVAGWAELMGAYVGRSFGDGIYRLCTEALGQAADAAITEAFPEREGSLYAYAFDWLGCILVLDARCRTAEEPHVASVDLATGDVTCSGTTFAEFHDEELLENPVGALCVPAYEEWGRANREAWPLPYGKVLGHKVPLVLGGSDDPENAEVVGAEVEWWMNAQILSGVRGLPDGTPVTGVKLG